MRIPGHRLRVPEDSRPLPTKSFSGGRQGVTLAKWTLLGMFSLCLPECPTFLETLSSQEAVA
jgi:hypothetical protein